MSATIKCWEMKNCNRVDCPSYGNAGGVCWLEPFSACDGGAEIQHKIEECVECPVFEAKMDLPLMKRTLLLFDAESKKSKLDARDLSLDLSLCFSEVYEMVTKIRSGDPSARLQLETRNELLIKLQDMLNDLAESLQKMVADSHEMAIGLCEHYDTLNKIAAGFFDAKANEHSPNELIAKLGALMNKETLTLVGTIENLRTTKEELKAAYQQLQDIIDFLPDGTFVINCNGMVIAWNRAIEEITGCPKESMIGRSGYAYSVPFYGKPRPCLIDLLDRVDDELVNQYAFINQKGNRLDAEIHIPCFRGIEDKCFWAAASPLFDRSGNRVGAIESIRDITHYKNAEEEKKALQDQLRQAQKMEAVGRLAGGIAHDFNNLLTAIIGYTSLLSLNVEGDQKLTHYVGQIDLVVRKAAKLTKDILTFSRKQIINPTSVDLLLLITGMEDMLRRLIGEDIQLSILYAENPLMAQVDSGQFQQVVLNLVTNARDAMPHGGSICISTQHISLPAPMTAHEQRIDAGEYALITVSDTGAGMDEATRERIFEPFYTTKDLGKGTGLGLSIAFGIISQHKGLIRVETAPVEGTRFLVYLPIYRKHADDQVVEGDQSATGLRGGSETLLLAEDSKEAREVLTAMLEGAGYRLVTAVDGEDAVAKFRQRRDEISLVILDVIMPHLNGKEAHAEMEKIAPGTRVIFTSGYTPDIICRKGQFSAGANFISKPAAPGEFLRMVRDVLDAQ